MTSSSKDYLRASVAAYVEAGFTIIPLNAWDAPDNGGKRPRDRGWTNRAYDAEAVLDDCVHHGLNVGARPGSKFVAFDSDPRNGTGFEQFCCDYELDSQSFPKVYTGGGGTHHFARLAGAPSVRKKLPQYNGMDILSGDGVQVVCAGSKHPSGNVYEWAEFDGRPELKDAPVLDGPALEAVRRPNFAEMEDGAPEPHLASNELVAEVLGYIDVTEFRNHDEWFQLMVASHAVSGGAAEVEFINWSIGDPEYEADAEIISGRWNSLDAERTGGITGRSFYYIAKAHGVPASVLSKLIGRSSAQEDFADDLADSFLPLPMKYEELNLSKILDHAERCLIQAGAPIYQTNGRLVYPLRLPDDKKEDGIKRVAGALTVQDVHPLRLREWMTEHVPLYKEVRKPGKNGEKGKLARIAYAAPTKLASHQLVRQDKWQAPVLHGVIEAPTLRLDGTLLSTPGY